MQQLKGLTKDEEDKLRKCFLWAETPLAMRYRTVGMVRERSGQIASNAACQDWWGWSPLASAHLSVSLPLETASEQEWVDLTDAGESPRRVKGRYWEAARQDVLSREGELISSVDVLDRGLKRHFLEGPLLPMVRFADAVEERVFPHGFTKIDVNDLEKTRFLPLDGGVAKGLEGVEALSFFGRSALGADYIIELVLDGQYQGSFAVSRVSEDSPYVGVAIERGVLSWRDDGGLQSIEYQVGPDEAVFQSKRFDTINSMEFSLVSDKFREGATLAMEHPRKGTASIFSWRGEEYVLDRAFREETARLANTKNSSDYRRSLGLGLVITFGFLLVRLHRKK